MQNSFTEWALLKIRVMKKGFLVTIQGTMDNPGNSLLKTSVGAFIFSSKKSGTNWSNLLKTYESVA